MIKSDPRDRFRGDQMLGFGPCKAETRTGRPCTNYAVGRDGRCRIHRKRGERWKTRDGG